jgi:hypothetical protein
MLFIDPARLGGDISGAGLGLKLDFSKGGNLKNGRTSDIRGH